MTNVECRRPAILNPLFVIRNYQLLLSNFFLARNSLALTFSCTAVSTCTLTTKWQTFTMTQTTVASNIQQTLNVHLGFTTQSTFGFKLGVDDITNRCLLIIIPLVYFLVDIDASFV